MTALVLGGGGTVGRAWLAGLITGLRDRGVDLGQSELIIGTSAGAVAGAQLALGLDLAAIVADEARNPGPFTYPPDAAARLAGLFRDMMAANDAPDPDQARAAIGATALAADTVSEEVFLRRPMYAVLAGRPWPAAMRVTSISATTGKLAVWSRDSGVELAPAVASSTALPGLSPAVTLGGDRYLDGGVRSMLNADLAAGSGAVVVVSCFPITDRDTIARREFDAITSAGGSLTVIEPETELRQLTGNGTRMLDLTLVPDALDIGRRQAATEAPRLG